MRILYAAGNRLGSYYQLKRFLDSVANKNHIIKVAAYKKSMGDLDVDFTLDCLLNFTNPDATISFNGNYAYYHNEIKRFGPDLIISDLELYTSTLANELNIKLWQVSPINLYYAMDSKVKQASGIHKHYAHFIESDHKKSEYTNYVLNNSDRKFVLSHLCDCEKSLTLLPPYEWARSSFTLGDDTNEFNNVIALAQTNKKIMDEFKNKNAALFSPFVFEQYEKMVVDGIESDNYANSIQNCNFFISDGTAAFLADAFYNEKYCFTIPRYDDIEAIIGSYMNEYCGIGKIDLGDTKPVNIQINNQVKFISEYLEEI